MSKFEKFAIMAGAFLSSASAYPSVYRAPPSVYGAPPRAAGPEGRTYGTVPQTDTRSLREFSVRGQKILAYSRKDAIKRYNHTIK